MTGGLIVTHGPMAPALIRAAETILGQVTQIYGFSTTDLSIQDILENIDKIVKADDWPDETLILVSLKGGSCWNAAVMASKQHKNIEVVSGVNLSMLLSFLTKRNSHPLKELATQVLEDGKRGIDKL